MTTETNKELITTMDDSLAHPDVAKALIITLRYVFQQQQSLLQMQRLTREVLQDGRDYGRIPGLPGKMLFDCGAQLIIGAFNCCVGHRRILSITDNPEQLSIIVEVPLMALSTGVEVCTGIGAASVLEPRNKYRWVDNPDEWGYDAESAKELKHEERKEKIVYQIPNPEPGELFNTIVKMASKRAEVDAAKNLPGAGSALKELLEVKFKASEDWDSFWGEIKRMGLKPDELTTIIGNKSVKEWQKLDKGNTLERALKMSRTYLENKARPTPTKDQAEKDNQDLFGTQSSATARPEVVAQAGPPLSSQGSENCTDPKTPATTPAPGKLTRAEIWQTIKTLMPHARATLETIAIWLQKQNVMVTASELSKPEPPAVVTDELMSKILDILQARFDEAKKPQEIEK